MSIINDDNKYIANTYARFPLAIVKGKGALCYDEEGKEYIDLGSGIAVNAFGYSDDEWVKAVMCQLSKVQHTSNLYYTEPCARLAELLCGKTGLKKLVIMLLPRCGKRGESPAVEAVFQRHDRAVFASLLFCGILARHLDGTFICLSARIGKKDFFEPRFAT